MDKLAARFYVFFEEPFWVGLFEVESEGKLSVCKVTFGSEPKDYELESYLLQNFYRLKFSPTIDAGKQHKERINPKRAQRNAHRQVENAGVGTKSQQALSLQHEQGKLERKVRSREQKEEEKLLQFELRQQKRKEKHRGR